MDQKSVIRLILRTQKFSCCHWTVADIEHLMLPEQWKGYRKWYINNHIEFYHQKTYDKRRGICRRNTPRQHSIQYDMKVQ